MSTDRTTVFQSPEELPFSFVLEGTGIRGIPGAWKAVTEETMGEGLTETTVTGVSPEGLAVTFIGTQYTDYPVTEWVVWFENRGAKNSGRLKNILAADTTFPQGRVVLESISGDWQGIDAFMPKLTAMEKGTDYTFAPAGGRPCCHTMPYFRLRYPEETYSLAIGWPGQWSACFTENETLRFTAGQELTDLYLKPGERIRTPKITALHHKGDVEGAINVWRRWFVNFILPKVDGHRMEPKLVSCFNNHGIEYMAATEENQLWAMDEFAKQGLAGDLWWIDAGWYKCYLAEKDESHWWYAGTWEIDDKRFPNGLRPVSEAAKKKGMDFLLWFEIERVTRDSKWDREHPDWLLKPKSNPEIFDRLLKLGDPECRKWLVDYITNFMKENGVRVYRQDFNMEPLNHWRESDEEDRKGISENLHVQGYLAYFDELRERMPDIFIDSCASGGNRNDLETMRRAVPLHYTDCGYGLNDVKTAFHHTMFEWLPYFKEFVMNEEPGYEGQLDSFSYHCAFAPMLYPIIDISDDRHDPGLCRKMTAIWRRAADFILYGDYYSFTPHRNGFDKWEIWQFDRPELCKGLVQGIRYTRSEVEGALIRLRNIDTGADYLFENPETGERVHISGETLEKEGFLFRMPRRSAQCWFYEKV